MSAYNFLLKKTNIKTGKQLIFYLTCMFFSMIFSMATVTITLWLNAHFEIIFIGIFMSLSNLVSTLMDVPIGYLQKLMPKRIILIFGILCIMGSMVIFIMAAQVTFIAFIAVLIYGCAYDFHHITMTSYILNISSPEEYSQSLSQKNVADSLGLLIGLLLATVINFITFFDNLPFVFILVVSAFYLLFITVIFDQAEYDTSLDQMDSDMVLNKLSPAEMASGLKGFFISSAITGLNKIEESAESLKDKMSNKNVIILKQVQPTMAENKESMIEGMKDSFKSLFHIFTPEPQWPLVWATSIAMFFSLWDTFVSTFVLIYVVDKVIEANHVNPMMSGVIIALIGMPLFICQIPFSKLADRFGKPFFIYAGSLISSIAIAMLGFSTDLAWVILAGMLASIGYAAAFPAVQSFFAQKFQQYYAKSHNTNEIDTNVSAGPLQTIVDFGDVIAQIAGAALISIIDFGPTFMVLGVVLFLFFAVGLAGISLVLKPILEAGESPVKAENTQNPPDALPPAQAPASTA